MNHNSVRWRVVVPALLLLTTFLVLGHASASDPNDNATLAFTNITDDVNFGSEADRWGHSAVWSDIDSNGDPDIYITRDGPGTLSDYFFANYFDATAFREEAIRRGVDDADGGSHGVCLADLDADGDYDIFNGTTGGSDGASPYNNLYRNLGGFFEDVTEGSGIPTDTGWPTRGVACFDMDRDGDLDLVAVSNYRGSDDPESERNEMYRNDGNWQFTPITSGDWLTAPAGQGVLDSDYDGDGDIDLIAANRTGDLNVLQNNGDGILMAIDPASIGITTRAGDGITSADIDTDGDLDLLLTGDNSATLYSNDGDGTFTYLRQFNSTDGYMGTFGDLDNDGDLDLIFAGDDVVFLNDGSGAFAVGPTVPVDGVLDPRSVALADIDNDGDLDFAVGVKGSRNLLIRNDFDSGEWLKINLIDVNGAIGAFGAKVFVYAYDGTSSELIAVREANSSRGYLAQDAPTIHVGLGAHTMVDVEVQFLTGETVFIPEVASQQTVTISGQPPTAVQLAAAGIAHASPDPWLPLLAALMLVTSVFVLRQGRAQNALGGFDERP